MIQRSDLKLKEHSGVDCVSFRMKFEDKDVNLQTDCYFKRNAENKLLWDFTAVIDDGFHAKQLYTFAYELPSGSMKLELIAAAGLLRFKEILQNEVQAKQVLDAMLYDAVSGM